MASAKYAAKLTDKIRGGIVVRFACRYTVEEVREWLKSEHGVAVEPSVLSYYNANNPGARAELSARWLELFDRTQAEYFANVDAIPIAHKAHRLRLANDAAERIVAKLDTRSGVNVVLLEKLQGLLEYAAKEQGEAFTNRRMLDLDVRGNLAKLIGVDPDELPENADA